MSEHNEHRGGWGSWPRTLLCTDDGIYDVLNLMVRRVGLILQTAMLIFPFGRSIEWFSIMLLYERRIPMQEAGL